MSSILKSEYSVGTFVLCWYNVNQLTVWNVPTILGPLMLGPCAPALMSFIIYPVMRANEVSELEKFYILQSENSNFSEYIMSEQLYSVGTMFITSWHFEMYWQSRDRSCWARVHKADVLCSCASERSERAWKKNAFYSPKKAISHRFCWNICILFVQFELVK